MENDLESMIAPLIDTLGKMTEQLHQTIVTDPNTDSETKTLLNSLQSMIQKIKNERFFKKSNQPAMDHLRLANVENNDDIPSPDDLLSGRY
jgi:hypothetical protein